MASWSEIETAHPDFAGRATELFEVHKHKTLATLRRDGAPRISGTEMSFVDGDIWFGGMPNSRKALDLRRDPRFALHGPTVDPSDNWKGDVKISGRAVEVDDEAMRRKVAGAEGPPGDFHLFRADITEVVVTAVEGSYLKIDAWREGVGLRSFKRT
ncbi:MAG: pyridoxamine 5'-phosphate oxidase family protein [Actinomycetota bacterium]